MKPKFITKVSPYKMGDSLLLSFDVEWIKSCNGIPEFEVWIDSKGSLAINGPVIKNNRN